MNTLHATYLIETPLEPAAVAVQAVFAEVLAVVGGDDHPGVRQDAGGVQFVEEAGQLGVEAGDAVVVEVAEHPGRVGQLGLAARSVGLARRGQGAEGVAAGAGIAPGPGGQGAVARERPARL